MALPIFVSPLFCWHKGFSLFLGVCGACVLATKKKGSGLLMQFVAVLLYLL